MAATSADFTTTIKESGDNIANQWPALVRAIQSVHVIFKHKVVGATAEPNDILEGLIFGEDPDRNKWRLFASGGDFLIQENTGSEASPTWTTRITFSATTGIDHDSLSGFVADEHVAHSGVTMTAGTGLSGGGTIAATRTFNLDINSLTGETTPAAADTVAIYDDDEGATNKATLTNLSKGIDHDQLVNFDADEHIDWSVTGAKDIHADRIPAAGDAAVGGAETATQAEMETATDTGRIVTPGRTHFHPGVAKAWAVVNYSGGTPSLDASYNVASIADTAQGRLTVNWDTDFSSADYTVVATCENASGSSTLIASIESGTRGAGNVIININDDADVLTDPASITVVAFGDH